MTHVIGMMILTNGPCMITVKFYRYDKDHELVVVHTEQCYDVFEAEQLVADDGYQYDSAEILQPEN